MKTVVCLVLFLSSIVAASGQDVDILDLNHDFFKEEESKEFYYVAEDYPLSLENWVASIRGVCLTTNESNLERMFDRFYRMNQKMGANSFKVDSSLIAADSITVFISLYHLSDEELDANWDLYPCNRVYVFGDVICSESSKSRRVKINKESVGIAPLTYAMFQNEIGEKVNVSIGGFFGAKYSAKGKEGKESVYISLGGGSVSPVAVPTMSRPGMPGAGIGVQVSTGSLIRLDMNYGQFLEAILNNCYIAIGDKQFFY
jgi:hypothetical protein